LAIEIYGGDPQVIAARDELARLSVFLRRAAAEISQAAFAAPTLAFDLVPNPLPNLQLMFLTPGITQRIEDLALRCEFASEQYFSNEAQVARLLQELFHPLEMIGQSMLADVPIGVQSTKGIMGAAAALAVIGLTGAPSATKSLMVGEAVRLMPAALGSNGPQGLLAATPIPDAMGSARLVERNTIPPSTTLLEHAKVLNSGYYNPVSSIRIHSFKQAAGNLHVVYVPGTQSFQLAGKNPLNITSNLTAMAGRVAPSQQGVEAALKFVGAGKSDKVLLVGHSQGSLIAANLAKQSHAYEVAGLISFGGPIAHLDLRVPVIAVQNSGDVVPGLSGETNPMRANWVTVQSDAKYPDLVSVHHMNAYVDAATALEGVVNQGLQNVWSQIPSPEGDGVERVFEISRN
jgi:hypothetical protein